MFLGIFQAPFNPTAYSVISDYFHPEYRTTANSAYNTAIYLGGGMSSLGSVMIGEIGWRNAYIVVGSIGMGAGALGLFFILEPTRGKFDPNKNKAIDTAVATQQVSFSVKAK